jgi:Predicted Zn-dependent peptidases
MSENIQTTRFSNGLTVITDQMPDVRSATLGFFFDQGSRHEPNELNGISHFIEHTVFKGTTRRSALEIAVEQDRLGGNLDAFTTHEETGFAIKVIDDRIEQAFDLIADMLLNPRFDEKELKSERRVIIEEIKMVEDSPEEYLGDLFTAAFFPDHPLGLSIAGTPKSVRSFNANVTRDYHSGVFNPSNLIITAAGNVKHGQVVRLAKKFFDSKSKKQRPKTKVRKPVFSAPILIEKNRNLEQAHIIIATPFVSASDKRRYAADLLANMIGGGMSSRLWQKVREERGLAYSVGASAAMFRDCGFFSIFAGTSPKQTEQVLDISIEEMRLILKNGVTTEELELAKQQSVASILLSLEDSAARAAVLGQCEMIHGRYIPTDETLAAIRAVTVEDINNLAREFFKTEKIAFAALGDLNGLKVRRDRLAVD